MVWLERDLLEQGGARRFQVLVQVIQRLLGGEQAEFRLGDAGFDLFTVFQSGKQVRPS